MIRCTIPSTRRVRLGVLALSLLCPILRAEQATILDNMDTASRWTASAGSVSVTNAHATGGNAALLLRYADTTKASFTVDLAGADLSRFDKVKVDIFLDSAASFPVQADAIDADGKTFRIWYTRLRPGFQVVELNVGGMASAIDVGRVDRIRFNIEESGGAPATIYLDRLRGTSGADDDGWLVASGGAGPSQEHPGNRLRNPGFELGQEGWGFWGQWDRGSYTAVTGRDADAHSGAASFGVLCQRRGRGGISQQVSDLPAGEYVFSYWVQGSDDGGRFFHAFEGSGVRSMNGDIVAIPARAAPTTWEKIEGTITIVEPVAAATLFLYATGTGTVYFDDVVLAPKDGAAAPATGSALPAKPRQVTVDGRSIRVDGRPFFMIGMYGRDPASLRETGFNFLAALPGLKDPAALDAVAQAGLLTWIDLQGPARALMPDAAPAVARPYQDHPAVLCYHTCDEPDHPKFYVPPAVIRRISFLMRKADTNHPTATVVMAWTPSIFYQYADAGDIMLTDPYDWSPADVVGKLATARKANPRRPLWAVLRAGWDNEKEPTADYIVATAYGALTCDVDGVSWFEHAYCQKHPAVWEPVRRVSLELRELAPFLLQPAPATAVACEGTGLRAILKEGDGKRCLIAVNLGPDALPQAKLRVAGGPAAGEAEVKFENRTVPIRAGAIIDEFAVHARHVYVF